VQEQASKRRGPVSRGYLIFVIAVLMLVNTIKVADRELLGPIFEPLSKDLYLNDLDMGLIRAATDATLVVGVIFFGLLGDRWKRRNVIGVAVLCWSAITWVTGMVQNLAQLLPARAGMAFFQAAFTTSAYPMMGDLVPRRSRGVVMGLMGATFALGTVLALLLTGLLGTAEWRRFFGIFGVPGLILGIVIFAFIREPARGGAEDEVLDGGVYSGRFTWSTLKQTLRIPSAWLVYLLDACQGSTWWAFSFWAPAYLVRRQIAPNPDVAALALLPAILGFVTGTILGGWLIDRLRRRTELSAVWVALLSTSGALLLSVVVFSLTSLTAVLVAGFFLGLFGYLIMPAINVILYDVVPPETRSSATAADGVVMGTVSALTGLAIGAVSQYVGAQQGLAEGNLRVAFQGAATVLLSGGIVLSLLLLRIAPRDMAALRKHVAERSHEG
jgi:MFS family permease